MKTQSFATWAGALALFAASLSHAQEAVPLETLPAGAPSGTLPISGIQWTVNAGQGWVTPASQAPAAYYAFAPDPNGVQTWTFSETVEISFGVNGLQGPQEGIKLPPGTQCTLPADPNNIIWNAATGVLMHDAPYSDPAGGVLIDCKLIGSTLTLDGSGLGPADYRRGLRYLNVRRQPVQPVPMLDTWALGLLGALLAGVAGWRRLRGG